MTKTDYSAGAAFIDGAYVPIAEAKIPILDWGFLKTDATYDVVHVWQGSFFRLDDHLDRFERSVAGLHMTHPYGRREVVDILMNCVRLTGLRDAYVEMLCTRGVPPPGTRDPRACQNRFAAFAVPFVWIANAEQRRRGLHLIVSSVPRIAPESVNPTIKNYHWGDFVRALYDAYEKGGETTVLVDGHGNLTEGPGFNIFVIRDAKVSTPARGVLLGITRRTVAELCQEIGVETEVGEVPAQALRDADEAFISSTAGGIMPVTRVDDRILGNGAPGPLTTRIRDLYWSKKEAGWYATPVDYGARVGEAAVGEWAARSTKPQRA